MPTIPPSITAVPTPAPIRGDKATFRGRVDAFITWLSTGVAELAAAVTNCYNNAVAAYNSATAAAASQAAAEASAVSASTAANAAMWVTGMQYAAGVCVWSPLDFATYRRKTAGAGASDPSTDGANWAPLLGPATIAAREFMNINYGGF